MLRMLVGNALPISSNVLRSTAIFSVLVLIALSCSNGFQSKVEAAFDWTLRNRIECRIQCLSGKIFGQARH